MRKTAEPTYAQQMVRPFWKALRRYPQFPAALIEQGEAAPDDVRVPVALGQQFLDNAVALTGDPDLGLRAARATQLGSFDVLEYVSGSAPSWRAAIEAGFRYVRIMNEAADFRLEVRGDKAHVVLHSTVPLTRAGIDFQSAAYHVASARWVQPLPPELEVWLTYARPADTTEHEAAFAGATLRFAAPWNGFVFDASRLHTKLASTDPSLHGVLREHAERLLAQLTRGGDSLVEQVRAQVLSTLKDGPLGAVDVAGKLSMSRRTLTRRLREHGTSFTELLEDVRLQAAKHYLTHTEHTAEDIAFLLGFSEASAFVRAFKRWQGETPIGYRRGRRDR